MTRFNKIMAYVAVFIVVASGVASIVVLAVRAVHNVEMNEHKVYQEGQRAYRLGVSAEANPYKGTNDKRREIWLNSWMDAKEQHLNEGK